MTSPAPDAGLSARAREAGVATTYQDWAGRTIEVAPDVVEAVLAQVGDARGLPWSPEGSSVAPLPLPARCWGWSVQLYATYSANSWGMGDLADLVDLAVWSARDLGADLILVNPLHAVAPVHPIVASPYSPTSRQFVNPLYLRIESLAAYRQASPATRRHVDAFRIAPPDPDGLIDRDAVWDAKHAALRELWRQTTPGAPDHGELRDFATFCALAEENGLPWQEWPEPLRRPESTAVTRARDRLADRIAFHGWVQRCCREQLAAAQRAATDAGMRIGIVHDLAVGVDPGGADAWMQQDVLAGDVSIGAPPDAFNQRGQDWTLPPWRPAALAARDFQPFRQILTSLLDRGGGIRVDHIMGLSRLWWIPPGTTPDRGTYVSYDAAAMLDALASEALDRDALVVGEDLGTVEPAMREAMERRGVLCSSVLWFERAGDDPTGPPKPPAAWREGAIASISTHDLPTAHGLLAGEHVRVRHELGLLGRPLHEERDDAAREVAALLALLEHEGLLATADTADPDAVTLAMHALLARTPSRVLLASLHDVLGELRQPNLPGTTDSYPNWRIPLPAALEQIRTDPRVLATAATLGSRG
jgi:4-alpha-glucanotransferase